jgi:hypothetical protein
MVALGYESGCNVIAQRASRMPRPFWRQKSTLWQNVCVISLAGFRQSGYGAKGAFSMACDRDPAVAAASALPILIMGR